MKRHECIIDGTAPHQPERPEQLARYCNQSFKGGYCHRCTDLIFLVGAEEPRVVALLDDDEGDARLVAHLELHARFADSAQLERERLAELALADAVAVEDAARRLEARAAVELDEQLAHHRAQLLDDLLPVRLHSDCGGVATRVCVHRTNDLGNTNKAT